MKYITLSYAIEKDSIVHIGLKNPELIPNNQISKGNGYNTYIIKVENHSGTHVDAPKHFIEDGKPISEYIEHDLIFNNPLIIDIPKTDNQLIEVDDISKIDLTGIDCVIFKTGFEKFHDGDPEKYLTQNPGISPDTILWIRKNFKDVRCLGIDCISISCYQKPDLGSESHLNAFNTGHDLGQPLLLIEDLKLKNIKKEEPIQNIIVVPWQINGIDSAPCTVLGIVKITR